MIPKYVVFDLPSGAGGMAAAMYNGQILRKVKSFSEQYKVHYKSKTHRYELRIWFEREEDYTLFFLVYEPDKEWRQPRIHDGTYEEK